MYKAILFAVALSIATSTSSFAANPSVGSLKFEYQNSASFPLKFTPQKIKWKYEKIRLWGIVENTGDFTYDFVSVSFTTLDKDRNFLGRDKWLADPYTLRKGEIGNFDGAALDTDGKIPAIIQVKITGTKE